MSIPKYDKAKNGWNRDWETDNIPDSFTSCSNRNCECNDKRFQSVKPSLRLLAREFLIGTTGTTANQQELVALLKAVRDDDEKWIKDYLLTCGE